MIDWLNYRFPSFVQQACQDGSERIQKILESDRCLFGGVDIRDISMNLSSSSINELAEYEALEQPTLEQQLKVMEKKGKFKKLSSSFNPSDQLFVYSPNTLPYNPKAPLRNTLPFIPLQFDERGVSVDSHFDSSLVNSNVAEFISAHNALLTEDQLAERAMIREELQLRRIRSEICHLGSVVENDVFSISSLSQS